MRPYVDRFLRVVARVAMAVWFREVEVVGADRVPSSGPLVIVASHFNGILDPALVAATTPRVPRFLAAATFWRNPVTARLLDLVGALPVYRQKEGRTHDNKKIFEACYRALRAGDVVALFPEGHTHDEPGLVPLRTGAARIALGARQEGATGMCLVPIGLVYSAKTRPRSRALVRVGRPVHLDAELGSFVDPGTSPGPDNTDAVRRLTDELQHRLSDAALNYDDADLALVANQAAAVALRPAGAAHDWEPSLDELERCTRAIFAARPECQLEVIRTFVHYHDGLVLLGLRDRALVAGDLTPAVLRWQLGQLAAVGSLLPAAAVGGLVNAPAVGLVWAAGRLLPWGASMRGTGRLLAGLAALPASWAVLRWLLGRARVPHAGLVTALAGPGCGVVALSLVERLRGGGGARRRALRSARESVRRLRAHASVVPALHGERRALVEAVVAAVESAGDEEAVNDLAQPDNHPQLGDDVPSRAGRAGRY